MRPQLGDTIISRYVLVSPLCEEQGLQVWKATDQILDQECQLFIILDASAVGEADTAASVIAASTGHRCTPILHIHHEDNALIIVTEPDTGVSLAEYLDGGQFGTLGYDAIRSIIGDTAYTVRHLMDNGIIVTEPDTGVSLAEYLDGGQFGTLGYDAIRSIIGDTAYTVRHLMDNGVVHHAISANTVRVSTSGIQLADTPVSMMIADSVAYAGSSSAEELAICQLSALLYRLLTHRRYEAASDMEALPEDTPYEFRLICSRGLRIGDEAPLASIPEFMALLNAWVTVPELGDQHLPLPTATGQASVQRLMIRPTDVEHLGDQHLPLPTATGQASVQRLMIRPTDVEHLIPMPNLVTSHPAATEPDVPTDGISTEHQLAVAAATAATANPVKSLWDKGRTILAEGIDSGHHTADSDNLFGGQYPTQEPLGNERLTVPLDVSGVRVEPALAEGIDSGHHTADSDNLFGGQYPTQEPLGNERLTVPLDVSGVRVEPANPFEETSRIPVIDDNGVPVDSASARALQTEQAVPDGTVPPSFTPTQVVRAEDLDDEDVSDQTIFGRFTTKTVAIIAAVAVPDGTVPPSFTPTQVVRAEDLDDEDVSDQTIFGRFTTKTVAIIAAVVVLIAALCGTMHILSNNSSDPNVTQTDGEAWPEFNPDEVPFGGDDATAASDDKADDTDKDEDKADQSEDQSDTIEPARQDGKSEDAKDKSDAPRELITADKEASAVPTPRHVNTTPFEIQSESFINAPSANGYGYAADAPRELITADKEASAVPTPRHVNTTPFEIQSESFINAPSANGYGYAVHLTQPQDIYRMVITIRSSGGRGYVKVNTTDPNAGEQVAEFTFAEGGTTEVMFDKMVNTQDILLWVPTEDLPKNQLYIDEIQFF